MQEEAERARAIERLSPSCLGAPPGARLRLNASAEQLQDHLAVLVGDGWRLHAELLLNLKRLETRRLLVHVGVHQRADPLRDRVREVGDEVLLQVDASLGGAKVARSGDDVGESRIGDLNYSWSVVWSAAASVNVEMSSVVTEAVEPPAVRSLSRRPPVAPEVCVSNRMVLVVSMSIVPVVTKPAESRVNEATTFLVAL